MIDFINVETPQRGAVLVPEIKGRWPGNLDILFKLVKAFHEDHPLSFEESFFNELQSDTVNARILWRDLIFTRDHNVIKTVLATGFLDFAKGDASNKTRLALKFLFGLLGNGILNTDGEEWKAHRALLRPFFARERVSDLEYFNHYSNKTVELFLARALSGESIDVQDVFGRFTLDVASEFLFATTKLNTLDLPLPRPGEAAMVATGTQGHDYGEFLNALEQIQLITSERVRRSWVWPLYEWWGDATSPYNKAIDDWVAPLIQGALEAKKKRGSEKMGANEASLTDHLVDSTDNLKNILLASRETTSTLLTFLLYMLSEHPEATMKLRAEIMEIVPEGAPTFENVMNMKYLRACLNETLRLFAPVPLNMRGVCPPFGFPCRSWIQADDLWGADAEEFSPERWIKPERLKIITSDPSKFIPFNAGPLMVKILQVFRGFELHQEDAPPGSLPPSSWKHGRASRDRESVASLDNHTAF
ncbi:hypothetical protein BS47DRAFT_1399699 [Hydnum rufescens UP504]|uniref:Cytochrome P450 n=1 Tax=Hydnum rufescens UP504 TaxID=1448309 RepID=A0A9P6AI35_9AGAM|nr:hypothetical protein BS47DRAFT_1399699 [Hydnum rufescens UP504]